MKYETERFLAAILFAVPVYLILRMPWRKKDRREWALGAFWVLMAGLFAVIFSGKMPQLSALPEIARERIKTGDGINIVPLKTIRSFLAVQGEIFYVNVIGNVVLFVPLGLGLPMLWQRMQRFFRLSLTLLAVPCAIEFIQLFIGRSVDIDDVILNFIGGASGAVLYVIIRLLFPRIKSLAR